MLVCPGRKKNQCRRQILKTNWRWKLPTNGNCEAKYLFTEYFGFFLCRFLKQKFAMTFTWGRGSGAETSKTTSRVSSAQSAPELSWQCSDLVTFEGRIEGGGTTMLYLDQGISDPWALDPPPCFQSGRKQEGGSKGPGRLQRPNGRKQGGGVKGSDIPCYISL